MKIVFVSHMHLPDEFPPENVGGMQRVSVQLMKHLKERDDIKVVPVLMNAVYKRMGPPSVYFWIKTLLVLPFIVLIHRPDVVLNIAMTTSSINGLNGFAINRPVVTINHGHDVTMSALWYQWWWLPHSFRCLDGVISVSRATHEASIQRGMRPDQGVIVPNGFDIEQWDLSIGKKEARKILNDIFGLQLKKNTKILLTVGRQVKRKGHAWFLKEVLPKIKEDVVYLAIGSGAEHERLLAIREQSKYKDKVFLVGRQSDKVVQLAYAGADLFLMPNIPVLNDMEGFGLVLLEAGVNETPAVAADLEGIKDVVADGKNGYKIPVGNADAFSTKVDELCSDEKALTRLQKSSRQHVINHFQWSSVTEQYIQEIQKFIDKSKEKPYKNATRNVSSYLKSFFTIGKGKSE